MCYKRWQTALFRVAIPDHFSYKFLTQNQENVTSERLNVTSVPRNVTYLYSTDVGLRVFAFMIIILPNLFGFSYQCEHTLPSSGSCLTIFYRSSR